MKKIFTAIILIFVLILSATVLCACQTGSSYRGIKVVYDLQGGSYKQGKTVAVYYNFPDGAPKLIKRLEEWVDDSREFVREGYNFVDWYKDEECTELWDFSTDEVTEQGVTLYAGWESKITYSYKFYDYDTNELLGTKVVNEGSVLNERYIPSKLDIVDGVVVNYTRLAYYEKKSDGTFVEWNSSSPVPKTPVPNEESETPTEEDDSDTADTGDDVNTVNVYVKYIEGIWSVIKTASDLQTAMTSGGNIYLYNDIDMDGANLCFDGFGTADDDTAMREFRGNGYTVSNFKVSYVSNGDADSSPDFEDDTKYGLKISLFVNPKKLYIHDVSFADMSVEVNVFYDLIYKIYVAPIAVSATDLKLENVSVNGEIKVTRLPDAFYSDETKLEILSDKLYFEDYSAGCETSGTVDCQITVTDEATGSL